MGYTTQLLIALVYKTGTKLMLRQSSSTLVKYVNYLIVMSININENCRSKRKFVKRKNQEKKGVINSHLRILVQHSNDLIYIFTDINEIMKIIVKFQKKISGYVFKITHIAAARCPK